MTDKQPKEQNEELNTLAPINFANIRLDGSDSWRELWDDSLSCGENIESLLRQCVAYPNPLSYKLATIYMMLPSALSRICPLLVCYGAKGSGKSTTGFIAAKLYNVPVLSAADTFASVRNALNHHKYMMIDADKSSEINTIMVWDDLDPSVFVERPNLYRMLKSGYNRNSDSISIASNKAGENIVMRVFCPRILSSVSPLHNFPDLDELSRRCIVIATKPLEQFTPKEYAAIGGDDFEPLDLQTINWQGLNIELFSFWNDEQKAVEFSAVRRTLARKNNKYRKQATFSANQWSISVDLMATAIVAGIFDTNACIDFFGNYWAWHKSHCQESSSAFANLLSEFIDSELSQIRQANNCLREANQTELPEIVDAQTLKKQVAIWQSNGQLDKRPTIDILVSEMRGLGFKLAKIGWVKMV